MSYLRILKFYGWKKEEQSLQYLGTEPERLSTFQCRDQFKIMSRVYWKCIWHENSQVIGNLEESEKQGLGELLEHVSIINTFWTDFLGIEKEIESCFLDAKLTTRIQKKKVTVVSNWKLHLEKANFCSFLSAYNTDSPTALALGVALIGIGLKFDELREVCYNHYLCLLCSFHAFYSKDI